MTFGTLHRRIERLENGRGRGRGRAERWGEMAVRQLREAFEGFETSLRYVFFFFSLGQPGKQVVGMLFLNSVLPF